MSATNESVNVITGRGDVAQNVQQQIPSLVPVTLNGRELWEDYRNEIEAKAQKHYSMPCTFKMVPLKMSVTDIEGIQTFFFKARVPNNKFVNVRIRLSGESEARLNQVAVQPHATGDVDEEITQIF